MPILDQHGNRIQSATLQDAQTAKMAHLRREFAGHPARGLTPQRLAHILRQAEQGDLVAQAELFADMEERDAHLYAEMDKRRGAILTLPWSIEPPENASPQEKQDADWLRDQVKQLQLDAVLPALMQAIGYGYQCVELTWQLTDGVWLPSVMEPRPASWFRVDQDDQNRLLLRDMGTGTALQPFSWITHTHRAKSGYIARAGLYRVLAWPYLFKNYALNDLAEFLEVYGLPIRLGKYPAGTGDAEKATLLRAVSELGHSAAGIIPDSMMIEFQNAAAGSHEPYLAMAEWADKAISKAVLGATLTTQADGKSSTNALGTVHEKVRTDILASDARQLAVTLTRDLLYPILAINRGNRSMQRLPQWTFDTSETEDLQTLATALPPLVAIGLPVPASWALKRAGIPAAAAGDVLLQAPAAGAKAGLAALAGTTPVPALSPLNQMIARLNADAAGPWQQVVDHITRLVNQATSLEQLQDAILTAYAGLPLDDMRAVLAHGLQAGQLAGMASAKDGE